VYLDGRVVVGDGEDGHIVPCQALTQHLLAAKCRPESSKSRVILQTYEYIYKQWPPPSGRNEGMYVMAKPRHGLTLLVGEI
jgi:hypothetical protein